MNLRPNQTRLQVLAVLIRSASLEKIHSFYLTFHMTSHVT